MWYHCWYSISPPGQRALKAPSASSSVRNLANLSRFVPSTFGQERGSQGQHAVSKSFNLSFDPNSHPKPNKTLSDQPAPPLPCLKNPKAYFFLRATTTKPLIGFLGNLHKRVGLGFLRYRLPLRSQALSRRSSSESPAPRPATSSSPPLARLLGGSWYL